ncbi:MAG: putative Ig domain-containing protein, partial [Terriglobia bacterium]
LSGTGGTPPYSGWSVVSGQLPPGLSMSSSGVISGTPTTAGAFVNITVQTDDSAGETAQQLLSLLVAVTAPVSTSGTPLSQLQILAANLPLADLNQPYDATLSAASGAPPYTWAVSSGSLPPGLTLNSNSGQISGSPTKSGNFTMTITARDAIGDSTSANFSIEVFAQSLSSPQIVTTDLHLGDIQQPYNAVLTALGGAAPYTWTVTSGSLPPGLALDSTSGQISGTPTQGGTFSLTVTAKDSKGASASANFSVEVFEQPLDEYGGLINMPSPNGGTGYFRVERFGSRWTFVDPLGNAFWLFSIYSACPGGLNPSVIRTGWGTHLNERLQSWGFNTLGEFTSTCDTPIGANGNDIYDIPQMPVIMIIDAVQDAMFNPQSAAVNLPEAVKNISAGVPKTTWTGWRGPLPDVYDPKFATGYNNEVSYWVQQYTGGFANKSWILGITTDDADNLYGFKSGGNAPVNNYPNPSFLVATAQFQYTAADNPAGVAWVDPKLYSKYAWISFLEQKYVTIAALNAAWGTGGFYTSFDDAGGYGTGTGVIDEDGRHAAWMGNDPYMLNGTYTAYGNACLTGCIGASAGVQTDLNAFLYQFVKEYATVAVTAIRAVDKNHLIFGPAAINNYGAKARDQVLQGLSDGGIDVFQFNYDPAFGPMAGSMAENNQSYDLTGKPAYIWYSLTANTDSTLSGLAPPYGEYNFPTQGARGQHYENVDIPNFLNAQGSNGDHYVLGIDWWDVYDDHSQNANWGLITNSDNPYDGKAARIAPGEDSWGFTTGGEAADYGDFLDSVTQANLDALRQIVAGK